MPTNHHEITQSDTTVELTVHWEYGATERGDRDTPDYHEPCRVTHVYDENGNDVTDWACRHIGDAQLIDKRHTEIKEGIQIPNQ